MAIGSALLGEHVSLKADLIAIAIYGLGAIFLLNISSLINEFIIFNKFKVKKEILEDENAGTGIIEAANYITTGLIILGASKGAEENLMIVVYWAIAQVALIISSKVYNIITPYDIHTEIEKDNVAVVVIDKTTKNQTCNGWIMENDKSIKITSINEIPLGHKIALKDLKEGDTILKYGHDIGKVVKSIKKGDHVHVHNVKTKKW